MVEKVFLYDETALETDTECKTFKLDVTAPLWGRAAWVKLIVSKKLSEYESLKLRNKIFNEYKFFATCT